MFRKSIALHKVIHDFYVRNCAEGNNKDKLPLLDNKLSFEDT